MLTYLESRYLLAIYREGSISEHVKPSKIAELFNVKTPTSISILQGLVLKGYIIYTPRVGVKLTTEGSSYVMSLLHKHRVLECFLHDILGFTREEAHEESSKIDFFISNKFSESLCRLLNIPEYCPCGFRIPHRH
ncbi:MAG: metal-dependent transcriptional regulator [Candidatus Bathyarchaeia archaeon]